MTLETIYIARHGYRSNWLPPPHPPNPTGIDSDPRLAPHGVDQAEELGAYLASLPEDQQPQFIISSPFYRCVETAQPYARKAGLKIHIDRGVGEWFKKSRGVVPVPAGYDQLRPFFPELGTAETWNSDGGVFPREDGESEDDILDRSHRFWAAFIPAFEKKHPDVKRILIVNHAASKIALGMALMQFDSLYAEFDFDGKPARLQAGTCSLDKYARDQSKWTLLENGRTDFLSAGEEMNWNFDVKVEAGSDEDIKRRQRQSQEKEAFQDVYVTVDVPVVAPHYYDDARDESPDHPALINPNAKFQITSLEDPNPLFRISDNTSPADRERASFNNSAAIDNHIFSTRWAKLVGTEMVFDDYGEHVASVKEHLVADPSVRVREKPDKDEKLDKDAMDVDEEADSKTAFLRRALAAARAKSND